MKLILLTLKRYLHLLPVLLLLLTATATNAGQRDVTLAWDANTEEDLAGYQIHYGTEAGNYTTTIDVGNVIQYTIPGLEEGTEYNFAATAYDNAEPERNESKLSVPLVYTVPYEVVEELPEPASDFLIVEIACIADNVAPDPVEIILDDGDVGTSGNWGRSGASGYYGSQSVYDQSGTVENPSTYAFEADITGRTNIALWWTVYPNPPDARCGNVPVDIYDGYDLLYTAYVNQQKNGGRWNGIGDYIFTGEARVVIRSEGAEDDADGEPCGTCADAIRFRQ